MATTLLKDIRNTGHYGFGRLVNMLLNGIKICYVAPMYLKANRLLILFLSLTLVIKSLIPAGYMPDMASLQNGSFKIMICTAYGAKEILLDDKYRLPGQENHKKDGGKTHEVCPFSAFSYAAITHTFILFSLLAAFAALTITRRHDKLVWRRVGISLSRAPPCI